MAFSSKEALSQVKKDLKNVASIEVFDLLQTKYLGRKSEVNTALAGIGNLPPEQRGSYAKEIITKN